MGSWFLVYGGIGVLSALVQVAGFALQGYFPNSDLSLLLVFLILCGICCVPFAFVQVEASPVQRR